MEPSKLAAAAALSIVVVVVCGAVAGVLAIAENTAGVVSLGLLATAVAVAAIGGARSRRPETRYW